VTPRFVRPDPLRCQTGAQLKLGLRTALEGEQPHRFNEGGFARGRRRLSVRRVSPAKSMGPPLRQ